MPSDNPFASPSSDSSPNDMKTASNALPANPSASQQNYQFVDQQTNYINTQLMAETIAPAKTNGLAIASLVVGILSVLLFFWFGIILGIAGCILGGLGIAKANKNPQLGGKTMAVVGLVLSIVGFILNTVMLIVVIVNVLNILNNPQIVGK